MRWGELHTVGYGPGPLFLSHPSQAEDLFFRDT